MQGSKTPVPLLLKGKIGAGFENMANKTPDESKLQRRFSRRRFVKLLLAAAAALGLSGCAGFFGLDEEEAEPEEEPLDEKVDDKKDKSEAEKRREEEKKAEEPGPEKEKGVAGMPLRELGKTGCMVSILGLGGSFTVAAKDRPEEAEKMVHRALDLGVNYIDTAPSYGASEENIGRALKKRRSEVFLASKTIERTYDGTMKLFEQSLKRLQTDHLDLLQIHGLHSEEELSQVMAEGGALEALEELKKEGLIRFTGVTGHRDPAVLLEAIETCDFDCVLLSLNPADPFYQPLQEAVLPRAREKNMGIIAMKIAAYGRLFRENGLERMEKALGYALSFPVSTAVVGMSDLDELEENARLAKEYEKLSPEELQRLEELVEPYQGEVNFFKKDW